MTSLYVIKYIDAFFIDKFLGLIRRTIMKILI